jgi:hypothetical protein
MQVKKLNRGTKTKAFGTPGTPGAKGAGKSRRL